MELIVNSHGNVQCVYAEAIGLTELGTLSINRASLVDADQGGFWWADMHPIDGPLLGPYQLRSAALEAEQAFLTRWLEHPD